MFWQLLKDSVITQSVLTIAVVGVWLYMVAAQITVPTNLTEVVLMVVGFFFGTKAGFAQGRYARSAGDVSAGSSVATSRKSDE